MAKSAGRRPRSPATSRLPSREDLLRYIASNPDQATRRDLARAFQVKGGDRAELTRMLRELEASGALPGGRPARRPAAQDDELPSVAVLEVSAIDADGELIARPAAGAETGSGAPRTVRLQAGARVRAPGVGDRVLARLSRRDGDWHGQIIRILPQAPARVVGVVEGAGERLRVRPLGGRARELELRAADAAGAVAGELVVAERTAGRALGRDPGRVIERLGRPGDPRTLSLIAAHSFELRIAFPPELDALTAADVAPFADAGRDDLRALPLVTIDGADARDFDDAVSAAPDDDPANPGGWQLVVAIADVAHYVRPGDPLGS